LLNPGKGWYTPQLEHPFGEIIAASHRNIEPYADAEYYYERIDCNCWIQCLGPVVSVDIRDRTIYNFAKFTQRQPEDTEVSTNLMVGVRQPRKGHSTLGRITPTYYLRYYHGVNPFGQFRNQGNFTLFGSGVHFDF